jgi:hypothetical protein
VELVVEEKTFGLLAAHHAFKDHVSNKGSFHHLSAVSSAGNGPALVHSLPFNVKIEVNTLEESMYGMNHGSLSRINGHLPKLSFTKERGSDLTLNPRRVWTERIAANLQFKGFT